MPSNPTSWAAARADGWKSWLNSCFCFVLFIYLFVCRGGVGSGSDFYLYPQGIHLNTFKMSKFTVLSSKDMQATDSKNNTSVMVLTGTEFNWDQISGFLGSQCLNQCGEQGEKIPERCVTPQFSWHQFGTCTCDP